MGIEAISFELEALGATLAVLGAILTANKRPLIGYPVMAVSCIILCTLFVSTGQTALLVMQGIFLVINLNGMWAWSRPAVTNEEQPL